MRSHKLTFFSHGDARGQLIAIEGAGDIPFEIKRAYYMYDINPGVVRGCHSHKALRQVLICVHGSCKVLLDDGTEREEILLDNPAEGLYIPGNMWREMYDFSPGTVLLVLASEHYDISDYIRDHDEFLRYVNEHS